MYVTEAWRIYYDDGVVFTSDDGPFEEAPPDGVLFVLQRRVGTDVVNTLSGADYYAMIDGEIIATGSVGELLRTIGWIKHGRWTSRGRFEEVSRRVAAEASEMARDGS